MKLHTHLLLLVVLITAFISSSARAQELVVLIVEPYIDFRTGPASEYPIFHVAEQGERITILKKKTAWYKARTGSGEEGWVSSEQLSLTRKSNGETVLVPEGSFDDYSHRDFEFSVFGGLFENVAAMSLAAAWNVSGNIVAEATYTQALGSFSENKLWSVRLQHHTFPEWTVSPYLTLGTGAIRTRPRANLVQSGDEVRSSDFYEVGAGLRYYLARNMVVKLEYRNILALSDRDENETIEEFKLGFAVFF